MDRVAVFVDAGYLFAQGAVALAGKKMARSQIVLDYERAIQALADFARLVSGLPLLRIYWYDGTSTGPTPQHIKLAHLSSVKVRLGFVNSVGEQKGVDSLIVTDMIALARNRAMADALLMSGDEDLRVGVQQAQELGVRVHLLGIRPSRGSQSLFLLQEADSTAEWGAEDLAPFFLCKEAAVSNEDSPGSTAAVANSAAESSLVQVAVGLAGEIPSSELRTLLLVIQETKKIPRELDSRLLAKGGAATASILDMAQKKALRAAFVAACQQRVGPGIV